MRSFPLHLGLVFKIADVLWIIVGISSFDGLSVALNFWYTCIIIWWIHFIIINILTTKFELVVNWTRHWYACLVMRVFNCHHINSGKFHTGSRKCLNSPSFSYDLRPNHRCQHLKLLNTMQNIKHLVGSGTIKFKVFKHDKFVKLKRAFDGQVVMG